LQLHAPQSEENGAGGKWDTLPEDWFAGKDKDYLACTLIRLILALEDGPIRGLIARTQESHSRTIKSLLVPAAAAKTL